MTQVVRLRSKRQQAERDEAAAAAAQLSLLSPDLLGQLPGNAQQAISRAVGALQRHARPDTEEGLWPRGIHHAQPHPDCRDLGRHTRFAAR